MNEKDPVTFRDKVTATEARLKLNKAAPDLLKACEAALNTAPDPCWYDHHGNCQEHNLEPMGECWTEKCRAAIAKAEGRNQS